MLSTINRFFDDASLAGADRPVCVLVTGGTGAGKTTLIRQRYSTDHVWIDAANLFWALAGDRQLQFGKHLVRELDRAGLAATVRALQERRRVVTELIGASETELDRLINGIVAVGYHVQVAFVYANPVEAYRRHLNAVNTDPRYVSAYFTEPFHLRWVGQAIEGGIRAPDDVCR